VGRRGGFVPPLLSNARVGRGGAAATGGRTSAAGGEADDRGFSEAVLAKLLPSGGELPESITQLDPAIVERVCQEIIEPKGSGVEWDSIAGLEHAKATVQEVVVWPMLNPGLFTGSRAPPKGELKLWVIYV
jgi:hypothetical protein